MGVFTDGFMEGFTGALGKGIQANEVERLKNERANALALKADSLANKKLASEEKMAGDRRSFEGTQKDLDRKSAEKIAGMKSDKTDKEDKISRKDATYLAQDTGLTEPDEINAFADRLQGKTVKEIEEIAKKEGWWSKKVRQAGELLGIVDEKKAPTLKDDTEETLSPQTQGVAAPSIGESKPSMASTELQGAPSISGKPQIPAGAKEAPPKALSILKNDPSKRNLALFKRRFGYIPQEYK